MVWQTVPFPAEKENIEKDIMRLFCAEWSKQGVLVIWSKNQEDHFDFTLHLPGGEVFIDLMELMYRTEPGQPYASRELRVDFTKYAKQICEAIENKSRKYGAASQTPIHLLTYITHWRFETTETVLRLVQYYFHTHPHVFENIFFLAPRNRDNANLRVIYPTVPGLFDGFDPSSYVESMYLNFDPAKWELHVSSHLDGSTVESSDDRYSER
ncbi:MAG: hypothetical protein QOH65_2240 [Methylobacteriaceae bacterium]|jgi:hypothetical protein|nr:hypothetical protein [Methylobacteriaceae bacterium]